MLRGPQRIVSLKWMQSGIFSNLLWYRLVYRGVLAEGGLSSRAPTSAQPHAASSSKIPGQQARRQHVRRRTGTPSERLPNVLLVRSRNIPILAHHVLNE